MKHVLSRLGGRGKKRQKASDASAAEPSAPVGGSDAADASVPPASAAAPVRSPFQVEIDGVADSAALRLAPPLEREGPVVFSRPLALHGSGTTIWGRGGPVVSIACSGVSLHDLQIEAVAEAEASAPGGVALEVAPGCAVSFQRVVVRGDVRGLSGEEGRWRYPHALAMGWLRAGASHVFRVRLDVPAPCRLRSRVEPVRVSPDTLVPGTNQIELVVDALPRDTLIHGDLVIESAHLSRAVRMTGHVVAADHAMAAAPVSPPPVLWEPPEPAPPAPSPHVPEAVSESPAPEAVVEADNPLPPAPAHAVAPAEELPEAAVPAPAAPAADPLAATSTGRTLRPSRGMRQMSTAISSVFTPPAPPPEAEPAGSGSRRTEPQAPDASATAGTEDANAPVIQRRKVTRQSATVPPLFGGGAGAKRDRES